MDALAIPSASCDPTGFKTKARGEKLLIACDEVVRLDGVAAAKIFVSKLGMKSLATGLQSSSSENAPLLSHIVISNPAFVAGSSLSVASRSESKPAHIATGLWTANSSSILVEDKNLRSR
ncbi:hypothetical protein ACA910_014862 [Epithemia clementina (nom. ined.)]